MSQAQQKEMRYVLRRKNLQLGRLVVHQWCGGKSYLDGDVWPVMMIDREEGTQILVVVDLLENILEARVWVGSLGAHSSTDVAVLGDSVSRLVLRAHSKRAGGVRQWSVGIVRVERLRFCTTAPQM